MKKLTLVFLLFAVFAACKKSKESKEDILKGAPWTLTGHIANPAFDYDGDGQVESDIYSVFEDCLKDNYFVFTDDEMEANEGPTKCSPSDPQIQYLDWEVDGNSLVIEGTYYDILELSSKKMVIYYNELQTESTITFTR